MYQNFYGFKDKPFEVTPDPRFLYLTRTYQEILSALIYGIRERRGFIALVGEVGTGKTLILNALLDRLERDTKVAFIFNSDLTFRQMLVMALYELGIVEPEEDLSKVAAIQRLNEFAIEQSEKGGNVVIIVDEAQGLSHRTMENIRMLSNLETRKHKLVQIVLSGQPELDAKLNKPEWRQLVQRISLKRYSTELSEEDTYGYVAHRLTVAGYRGGSLFTTEALQLIWQYSGGIPRKINVLCDNALLIGYGMEEKSINAEIVNEAINDLSWSPYLSVVQPNDLPTEENQNGYQNEKEPAILKLEIPRSDEVNTPIAEETQSELPEQHSKPIAAEIPPPGADETQTAVLDKMPALTPITRNESVFEKFPVYPDDDQTANGALRKIFQRFRSALIAGILILVVLTIATWILIYRSKDGVSEISHRDHNMVRLEMSFLQSTGERQPEAHTTLLGGENVQWLLNVNSQKC